LIDQNSMTDASGPVSCSITEIEFKCSRHSQHLTRIVNKTQSSVQVSCYFISPIKM
jgi:hypothetical protein